MGIENSLIKKKKQFHFGQNKFHKKYRHKNSETFENKKVPNLIDNFHAEEDIIETRPQSKTVKIFYQNKKPLEEHQNNHKRENAQNLKSFSVQNLVKLDNNHNFEDAMTDSLETNCCSNKSKEDYNKILNDEIYDTIDDNNSFEEDDDEDNNDEESNEEDENETEEEKKKKELIITNNIKTVFIDSKNSFKEHNEHNDTPTEENSRLSTLSMTTYDYELNFYRNGNDIRQSYLAKLVSSQIWTPNMKPKRHNSIIIFDWDDTLLPTSFLTPGGVFDENIKLPAIENDKLSKLEQTVLKLLTEAVEKGSVYIITNAGNGWVEYSANKFYPSIMPVLEKIKIISARGLYEKMYPGNSRQWKIEAFLNIQKHLNLKLVTNIICVGDSLFEMEAGRILASKFTEAFIKTIKFREAPKLDELLKQLKLVCIQFGTIYSSIKNLTIRVERKKKDGI
jgi:hypothetical protein